MALYILYIFFADHVKMVRMKLLQIFILLFMAWCDLFKSDSDSDMGSGDEGTI